MYVKLNVPYVIIMAIIVILQTKALPIFKFRDIYLVFPLISKIPNIYFRLILEESVL